jgi:hypothetical protein
MSSINVSSRSFNAALQCSKFKYFANDFFHHVSFLQLVHLMFHSPTVIQMNLKYVTILKPQDLQDVNKPKMWLNILNS